MLEVARRVGLFGACCFFICTIQIDHQGQRLSNYMGEGNLRVIFPVRIALCECAVRPYMLRSNTPFKM